MAFCAAIIRGPVCLSSFPFYSHIQVFWFEFSTVYRLKSPYIFFFLFLFSSYWSVWLYIVSAVTGRCNQSFFALFNAVFESRGIDASTLSSMQASPLPFFLSYNLSMSSFGCKARCIVIDFHVLRSIYMSSFFVNFKEWSRVSYNGGYPGIYPFDEISAAELCFEQFSRSPEVLFSYLVFHLHLFDDVCF